MRLHLNSRAAGSVPRWFFLLFLIFLIQLPFELPHSLIPLPGLVVTHLEITLAILLGGYVVWRIREGRPRGRQVARLRRPETWLVVWLGALALSALIAPGLHDVAVKSVLRSTAIATLFWISRDIHSSERLQRISMAAISGLAGVVAMLGILEGSMDRAVEPLLSLFRPMATFVDGVWRLTSTFSHANQTATWLAMALPLTIARGIESPRRFAWWFAVFGLILWALMETLSRSGIVAGLLVTLAMLLLWAMRGETRKRSGLLLLLLVTLVGVRLITSPQDRDRFGIDRPGQALSASYECPARIRLETGETRRVTVRVSNDGFMPWQSAGLYPVHLSYRVYNLDRLSDPSLEGLRAELPTPFRRGDVESIDAPLLAPRDPGLYLVAWDVVREKVLWFSSIDVVPGLTLLQVVPSLDSTSVLGDARFDEWYEDMPVSERLSRLGQLAKSGAKELEAIAAEPRAGSPRSFPADFDSTRIPRHRLWKVAIDLFRERPLTGWGPDSYRYIYHTRLGIKQGDTKIQAHNMYLEILSTGGLLAFASWLAFMGTLSLALRRRSGSGQSLVIVSAWAAVITTFSLHALFDSFLGSYEVMGVFWTSVGAAAASSGGSGSEP